MGYLALAVGLLFLLSGATGKLLPMKRPALFEIPVGVNRVICVWIGLVLTGFGLFLVIEGHKG